MKLSIPMLVLAAGLSAATTSFAQSTTASTSRSNTVLSDGTNEVRVESDGVTARVTLNGNQVAQLSLADDWTVHKVTNSSGEVIATIWRAGQGDQSLSASFGDIRPGIAPLAGEAAPWAAKFEELMKDERVRDGLAKARGQLETALATAGREMPRVMIGITMDDTPAEKVQGLAYDAANTSLISSVIDNGPAAKAGLREGDVIVAFDNVTTADAGAIRDALQDNNPGDNVSVSFIRDGAVQTATLTLEAYNAQAFGSIYGQAMSPGGAFQRLMLTDEEMSRLQKQIAELSEQLGNISSELGTAIGARAEELGKLSAEIGGQIAQLASELARRSAAEWSTSFWGQSGGNQQRYVRVVPDGSGGAQEVIVMPPTAPTPAAPPGAPSPTERAALQSLDDRIRQIEDRFGRVEELLQALAKQQANPSGGGNH